MHSVKASIGSHAWHSRAPWQRPWSRGADGAHSRHARSVSAAMLTSDNWLTPSFYSIRDSSPSWRPGNSKVLLLHFFLRCFALVTCVLWQVGLLLGFSCLFRNISLTGTIQELHLMACLLLRSSELVGKGYALQRLKNGSPGWETEQGQPVKDSPLASCLWCCLQLPSFLLLRLCLVLQHRGSDVFFQTSLNLLEKKKWVGGVILDRASRRLLPSGQYLPCAFLRALGPPPLCAQLQRGANHQCKLLKQREKRWSSELCRWFRKTILKIQRNCACKSRVCCWTS